MADMVILVMGVSGSGKSTLAAALADALGWELLEADGYHPAANIAKMAAGIPLDDADRAPWLARLREEIEQRLASSDDGTTGGAVLACSALRASYRRRLRRGAEERIPVVYLSGDDRTLRERLENRRGHYMRVGMLESQLTTLEVPTGAEGGHIIEIPINLPPERAVAQVRRELGL